MEMRIARVGNLGWYRNLIQDLTKNKIFSPIFVTKKEQLTNLLKDLKTV